MLDKKQLGQDKAAIEALIRGAQGQVNELQIAIVRWQGALGYIEDNLAVKERPKEKGQ